MALSDITARGVALAIDEFDRLQRDEFLKRYGFGRARQYFLVQDGRQYDSKAITGVAHGYDRSDLGPLTASDFSGGEAVVAKLLEALGYQVERPSAGTRNPPWSEEELILALDLYLRGGQLDDTDPEVIALSAELNRLPIHSVRPDAARFRNANGVALKLANLAAHDPNYAGRGMTRGGRGDAEVWQRYASDEDALDAAVARIRNGQAAAPAATPSRPRSVTTAVEAQHVEQFTVTRPEQEAQATRREQGLVLAYQSHLENLGHRVVRRLYPLEGGASSLACDLIDETEGVLYEAKGDVRRSSVRMAIGQLLDYRRFETAPIHLAILLPWQPSTDLIDLIHSVPASAVWRTKTGFERESPPAH